MYYGTQKKINDTLSYLFYYTIRRTILLKSCKVEKNNFCNFKILGKH